MSQISQFVTGGGGSGTTLTGDVGGSRSPVLGNFNLLGGLNINTSGAGNTITFNLDNTVSVTGNIQSTAGNIIASGSVLGFDITTNTSPNLTLTMEDNGLFAGGTNPDVDISLTTQGVGCVVIDGIAGGGLNSTWRTCQAAAQTVGLATVTLVSILINAEEMATVTFTLNGFKSTYDKSCGGTVTLSAYRPTGGNITLVGMVQTNFSASASAAARIEGNVNVGTQSIVLTVTGVAAETWNWVTTYSYMYTTHP
jgi:hypothetical protein